MEEKKFINDMSSEKATVSARINKFVYEQYKENEIPVSLVIETSLVHFLKLNDEEKIKFINENNVEKVSASELHQMYISWTELLKEYMKKMAIPSSVMASLFTNGAIGAISIAASFLLISNEKKSNDTSRK